MISGTTNTGEEFLTNPHDGLSVQVALVSEQLSNIGENTTIGNLTEPGVAEYSRQPATVSQQKQNGSWVLTNNEKLTFDVSGSSITIRSYVLLVNFQSSETDDSSSSWHILQPGAFTEESDLSSGFDVIEINPETIGLEID